MFENDQKTKTVNGSPRPARRLPWRLIAAASVILLLFVVGWMTDAAAFFQPERIQAAVLDAGNLGGLLFIVAFAGGLLLQIPGVVFVGAGLMLYGSWLGGGLVLLGALIALSASFWVVRLVGGKATKGIKNKMMQRVLGHLEARPVRTVAVLRVLMFLSPPVNYALALSSIRYRDYIVGSAVGLLAPLSVLVLFSDHFIH